MGKSYSYTVVVEPDHRLFINEQVVPTPPEATHDDVLGWALEQIRGMYASYYASDESSELTLKVEDRRPGGVKRRAKFKHPEGGISLASLRGDGPQGLPQADATPTAEPQAAAQVVAVPPPPPPVRPAAPRMDPPQAPATPAEPARTEPPPPSPSPAAPQMPPVPWGPQPTTAVANTPASSGNLPATEVTTAGQPPMRGPAPASPTPPAPSASHVLTRDEELARERGWQRLAQDKVTRPQIGSAENEGRSKGVGLMKEARKQKWVQSLLIALVILVVIVGFRVFNSGASYEAYCVDQRTMTRVVTGVACEDKQDTNHRWWYTSDEENAPDVGESIDAEAGTFDAPSGDKNTVNKHIERRD